MDAEAVRDAAADLPREPGVYQFLQHGQAEDVSAGEGGTGQRAGVPAREPSGSSARSRAGDTVLYVGKAVDIRDRVRSYADPRSRRIARMVARADAVDVAVTDTETQALLLEANLIKRHQPRYNVRLRDDKSYPLVQLTDHEFPRIEVTRDPAEGATVFGPFTNKGVVETVVKALRETYGVRGCSDYKFSNRSRPCLDFDIGLCSGPCVADTDITREAYVTDVEAVERFLAGESHLLTEPLESAMDDASANREFERAANLRDRLEAVRAFHEGGRELVSDDRHEEVVDVLGAAIEGTEATVARLHSTGGQLVDRTRHRLAAPEGSENRLADVLAAFLPQYYAERELPDAIILSAHLEDPDVEAWLEREGVAVRVPGAGREAKLVDLALKNARQRAGGDDELGELAAALDLDPISRIEGFDVSHAQGKHAVGSNVTFVDGSPEKSDYRRKRLPAGNDDYANMRALLEWRAERAVEGRDDRPDPDLLLIDGGDGQLAAAREALRAVEWDIPVVSLAKAEEIVFAPADGPTAALAADERTRTYDWPSDATQLHVLQRVRDEAHRFAVQYHQTLREDVSTALETVSGVGPETRRRLLTRFGSVDAIRESSPEELRSVQGVGSKTAERIQREL